MEDVDESQRTAKTAETKPARLTVTRFKSIQNFKLLSNTDPIKYGQLGSPKWGNELHTFLDDKGVSREDVQRWIDTQTKVTAPYTRTPIQQTDCSHELLRNERALRTYGRANKRPHNVSHSSTSSTDSKNSEDTVVSAITFRSMKKIRTYAGASSNPNILEDTPAPATGSAPECGMPITTAAALAKSTQVVLETQNNTVPLNPRAITQNPEVSPENEVPLEVILIGFGLLETLSKLIKKYENGLSSVIPTIHNAYRKLEAVQKENVLAKIPEPYLPEVKVEEIECIEIDDDMDNEFLGTMEGINLATDGQPTDENNMDTQIDDQVEPLDLSMKSNRGNIEGNIQNSQEDEQIEGMDLEGAPESFIDLSNYPNLIVILNATVGSEQN